MYHEHCHDDRTRRQPSVSRTGLMRAADRGTHETLLWFRAFRKGRPVLCGKSHTPAIAFPNGKHRAQRRFRSDPRQHRGGGVENHNGPMIQSQCPVVRFNRRMSRKRSRDRTHKRPSKKRPGLLRPQTKAPMEFAKCLRKSQKSRPTSRGKCHTATMAFPNGEQITQGNLHSDRRTHQGIRVGKLT